MVVGCNVAGLNYRHKSIVRVFIAVSKPIALSAQMTAPTRLPISEATFLKGMDGILH
jgi:hypothetical protein